MVLVERFDPDAVLDRIELHGCTWMLVLPFMCDALLECQRKQPRKVSSLRHCICGGDVFPIQLQVDFEATFGAPLRNIWATTEAVGALRPGLQPGPVTRIAPGAQVRLVDDEGRNVPRGEVGEFLVRGPYVTVGYWVGPDRIDDATRDGWYYSGDLMRQGEGDELWFIGRKKDIIIRGGSNISPVEVERVLLSHPLVRDAVVFGMPDPVLGQRVAAVVQLSSAVGDAALGAILKDTRRQLADYKAPERLWAVDAVPRNPLGKVDRTGGGGNADARQGRLIRMAWLAASVRTRSGNRLFAVPLPQTGLKTGGIRSLALRRSARSRRPSRSSGHPGWPTVPSSV